MPNWCLNKLTINNVTEEITEYLRTEGFSFQKIAPVSDDEDSFDQASVQIRAWGTKWDLLDAQQGEVAQALIDYHTAEFDTAWSPPITAIEALSRRFPEVDFELAYYEPGCWFWGIAYTNNGHTHDECFGEGLNAADASLFLQEHMGYDGEDADENAGVTESE